MKDSSLYADVRLTSPSAGIRGQPSWTIEEYKRNSGKKEKQLTALELQVQFWALHTYCILLNVEQLNF